MIKIIPISAFKDNYIWMLLNPETRQAIIVDPGDANPVLQKLEQDQIELTAILITHHHWDHSGGITELIDKFPVPVFGPKTLAGVTHPVSDGDKFILSPMGLEFTVLGIPGHTLDHLAYYGDGRLFCGDTLFSVGCGRVFEGTHEQMYNSLMKLAALPDETAVYCGHEYTLANLRFAKAAEPNNSFIDKKIDTVNQMVSEKRPTLPSNLREEKQTNPFLRCSEEALQKSVKQNTNLLSDDPASVFAALRKWKDNF